MKHIVEKFWRMFYTDKEFRHASCRVHKNCLKGFSPSDFGIEPAISFGISVLKQPNSNGRPWKVLCGLGAETRFPRYISLP